MGRRLVLGIGTGRCGTNSLAHVLDVQPSGRFTHELKPHLPWEATPESFTAKMTRVLRRPEEFVGDVAFYYLPYVEALLQTWPDARVICLRRAKEATVASYMKKTRGRNHWMPCGRQSMGRDRAWDQCYPKYEATSKAEAVALYWEEYCRRVSVLCERYPDSVRVWETGAALNTEEGLCEVLSFAGFPPGEHRLVLNVRRNRG